MLHHIGEQTAGQSIEEALIEVYRRGEVRTPDLGGTATTDGFADAIATLL